MQYFHLSQKTCMESTHVAPQCSTWPMVVPFSSYLSGLHEYCKYVIFHNILNILKNISVKITPVSVGQAEYCRMLIPEYIDTIFVSQICSWG